ncbi:ERF family protein [Enterococcus thailandicus]|uniref:ERF family protein n=1 Tax=Enterococcus TaxID=1350 RepID=UPI0028919680|nr:ERF family protein [Enterococcus thailandicus]MDT2735451.1 ERF family protein [Enterococcus thailandicus]MDT2753150.1 ERF family protein [Enterococcus thailandicus]
MKTSEETDEIYKGLYLLKGKLKQPKFDASVKYSTKKGENMNFEYATLKAIEQAIRTASQEAESGIDFGQDVTTSDNRVDITTCVYHSSGQYIIYGPLGFPCNTNNPQALGSVITYAKRYSLASSFGIVADGDDDAAIGADENENIKSEDNLQSDFKQTFDEYVNQIASLTNLTEDSVIATTLKSNGFTDFKQIEKNSYSKIIGFLKHHAMKEEQKHRESMKNKLSWEDL